MFPQFSLNQFSANNNVPVGNFIPIHNLSTPPALPFQPNIPMNFLGLPPNQSSSSHVYQNSPQFVNIGNTTASQLLALNISALTSVPPPSLTVPQNRPVVYDMNTFEKPPLEWNPEARLNTFTAAFGQNHQLQEPVKTFQHPMTSNFMGNNYNGMNQTVSGFGAPTSAADNLNGWIQKSVPMASTLQTSFKNTPRNISDINPWSQPSTSNDSGNLQNTMKQLLPNGSTRNVTNINPWSETSDSRDSKSNFQNTVEQFGIARNLADINPWSQPSRELNNFQNTTKQFGRFQPEFSPTKSIDSNFNWPISRNALQNNYNNDMQKPANYQDNHKGSNFNSWKPAVSQDYSTHSRNSRSETHRNQPNHREQNFGYKNNASTSGSRQPFNKFQNKGNQGRHNTFKTENSAPKPYSCDTCDRAFNSSNELGFHMSEHVKCNAGNCQFEAHPKIVALHKKMQHDTGYAETINKLKDSAEIEKWRAERKRRFPTAANILKRKAEQLERETRGEVIENKDFGKFKNPKSQEGNSRNKRFKGRRRNRRSNAHQRFENQHSISNNTASASESDSDDDSHITVPPFLGMAALSHSTACEALPGPNSETEQQVSEALNSIEASSISTASEIPVEGAKEQCNEVGGEEEIAVVDLTNGSMSDETAISANIDSDDEPPTECAIEKVPTNNGVLPKITSQALADIQAIVGDSDDEAPTELPIEKPPLSEISNSTVIESPDIDSNKVKSNTRFNSRRNQEHSKNQHTEVELISPVPKSTLLEKLLADDIRHERNVIMQCIRHVVKKKFFGIGQE